MTILPFGTDAFPVVSVTAHETAKHTWRLRSDKLLACGQKHVWDTSGPLSDFGISDDCPEHPFVELHVVRVVRLPGRSALDRMVAAIRSRQHHSGLLRMQVGATPGR